MNQEVGFALHPMLYQTTDMKVQDPEETGTSDDGIEGTSPSIGTIREEIVTQSLDHLYENHDSLLFGLRSLEINTASLHPKQGQIFQLWQIYLDNVDPLLKVTHTPTLQARFISAALDVASIEPEMDALMFSIYCVSLLSLEEDVCNSLLGTSKQELIRTYQLACKQALIKAGVLRTTSRECLTALFLYLVSPI